MANSRILEADFSNPQIIAKSPIMQKVLVYAANIAQSDSAAIIYGESGVGKGAMAHYIYANSVRRDGPLVTLNCAAVPADRIDLELWGNASRAGVFESAANGTLFLEDINALPFPTQINIYNAIHRRAFLRPGTKEPVECDVRVLAASQKNLKELVDAGTFFDNLYYTLSVFIITVPPLRQRKEDIIPLATRFLNSFNEKYHQKKTFEPETLHQFREALWPGNIRELQNTVERMYAMATDNVLRQESVAPQAPLTEPVPPAAFDTQPENLNLQLAMETYEKQFLQYVIEKCHGNIAESARQLGIHRTGLYKKLNKYGIPIIR